MSDKILEELEKITAKVDSIDRKLSKLEGCLFGSGRGDDTGAIGRQADHEKRLRNVETYIDQNKYIIATIGVILSAVTVAVVLEIM